MNRFEEKKNENISQKKNIPKKGGKNRLKCLRYFLQQPIFQSGCAIFRGKWRTSPVSGTSGYFPTSTSFQGTLPHSSTNRVFLVKYTRTKNKRKPCAPQSPKPVTKLILKVVSEVPQNETTLLEDKARPGGDHFNKGHREKI